MVGAILRDARMRDEVFSFLILCLMGAFTLYLMFENCPEFR